MTETIKLADLTPDARNANKGTKRDTTRVRNARERVQRNRK